MSVVNKLSVLSLTLLLGCATPYQPNGYRGGYEEMRLGVDVFTVTFIGNGYTGESTVNKYFLRRCAEVTAINGFDYFIFMNNRSATSSETAQISGGSSHTSGSIYGSHYNATTTYTAPTYVEINRHRREGIIRAFREGTQPAGAMKARIILENFKND